MRIVRWLLVAAATGVATAAAPQAAAQLSRTAVSGAGNDANSCAPAAPCRSFARAMSQTNANGEIVVLDSAGYGPFTVDRAVTVQAAPGVYAGITAVGGAGVTVGFLPASTRIVLRGLTLQGFGTGGFGFHVNGGLVSIERCIVNGFDYGIVAQGTVTVSDTDVRNNRLIGIQFANAGTRGFVDRTRLKNNPQWGLVVQDGAKATAVDTLVSGSGIGYAAISNGLLDVDRSEATRNTAGALSDSGGTLRIANSFVADNGSSGLRNDAGTMESFQNNRVRGNASNYVGLGTLTNVAPQ
jgi:hypothetical protein